jgi:hypothetical protein
MSIKVRPPSAARHAPLMKSWAASEAVATAGAGAISACPPILSSAFMKIILPDLATKLRQDRPIPHVLESQSLDAHSQLNRNARADSDGKFVRRVKRNAKTDKNRERSSLEKQTSAKRSIYGGNSSSPASDVKVAPSIAAECDAQIASIARQFGRNIRHLALDVSIDRGRTRQRGGAKSRVDPCVLRPKLRTFN